MSQKVSVDERRRLVAQSLQVGNPGNNARDLPGQTDASADGQFEHQIELNVDEIRPYENNPRRSVIVKFDDIKESIRTSGLRSPLTVTRRPGESHFIVEADGNTRLLAPPTVVRDAGPSTPPDPGATPTLALREPRTHRPPCRKRATRRDEFLGQGQRYRRA